MHQKRKTRVNTKSFKDVVTNDLHELQNHFALNEIQFADSFSVYMNCRRLYLAGETSDLEQFIQDYNKSPQPHPWLSGLMELRAAIRKKERLFHISSLLSHFDSLQEDGWIGEVNMVLAMYYEEQKEFEKASLHYKKSAKKFYTLTFEHKALTAEYNALINETLAFPNKRYLVSYNSFVKKALELKHHTLAGVCLANLSREYQLLGLLESSLEKSEKALELLEHSSFGTLHYYLTVAQNVDLLISLQRFEKAKKPYEELLSSPYIETAEIVRVIQNYQTSQTRPLISPAHLPAPWQERLLQNTEDSESDISDLETDLIQHLMEGPKSLVEVAELLYGDKIQFESSLARAKQAIYRLRKKKKGLIHFKRGKYEILD